MLQAIRVTITGQTASFRVPGFVAHQLTLPVPPLSTVYGLLSAAAGRWVMPQDVEWLGYRCEYQARGMDLEAIITYSRSKPQDVARPDKRNVIWREFLLRPTLTLYLPRSWMPAFRTPRYPLLLGRSQDLATVEQLREVQLCPVARGVVSGALLPLDLVMQGHAPAFIYNLPVAFGPEPERRLLGMQPFGALDALVHRAELAPAGWLWSDGEGTLAVPLYRREWVISAIQP